jgi:hypothetical protein
MDTPVNAIAPYVEQAVRILLVRFGGYQIPLESIEHWVRRLAERPALVRGVQIAPKRFGKKSSAHVL